MTSPFTPEQSEAAARVRSALVPGAVAVPPDPDRMFLRFAAAVVNQMLAYAEDAWRCCSEMVGPALPPATFVGREAADDDPDAQAAVAFALQWIRASGAGASGPERAEAALWFRTRTPVLPTVAALAGQAGWDQQCWQLAARCYEALIAEGALTEAVEIAAVGLAAAERCVDPEGIAVMHVACGAAAKMSGRLPEAMAHYDHATSLFEQLGDVRGQAQVELCRGAVHMARRELQAARDCQMAVLNTAGISPVFTALATGNLGRIAIYDGEFAEAIRCGTAALRIIDGAGLAAIRQVMEVHHDLADAHLALGHLSAAREHVSAALSAVAASQQDMTFASVHVAVHLGDGQLALAEGRPEPALQAFTRALAVRSGSTAHLANLLEGIGRALQAGGVRTAAVAVLQAAVAQRRVDGLKLGTARTLVHLAAALKDTDPQQASGLRSEALAQLEQLTDRPAVILRRELAAT